MSNLQNACQDGYGLLFSNFSFCFSYCLKAKILKNAALIQPVRNLANSPILPAYLKNPNGFMRNENDLSSNVEFQSNTPHWEWTSLPKRTSVACWWSIVTKSIFLKGVGCAFKFHCIPAITIAGFIFPWVSFIKPEGERIDENNSVYSQMWNSKPIHHSKPTPDWEWTFPSKRTSVTCWCSIVTKLIS